MTLTYTFPLCWASLLKKVPDHIHTYVCAKIALHCIALVFLCTALIHCVFCPLFGSTLRTLWFIPYIICMFVYCLRDFRQQPQLCRTASTASNIIMASWALWILLLLFSHIHTYRAGCLITFGSHKYRASAPEPRHLESYRSQVRTRFSQNFPFPLTCTVSRKFWKQKQPWNIDRNPSHLCM
jgi:hypothetical protein